MAVLIISSVADVHAHAVMAALAVQGCMAELLDLADFPVELNLSMEYSGRDRRFRLQRKRGGDLDLHAVTAVWWRRPEPFSLPKEISNPAVQRFVMSESATVFQGLYPSLEAYWINDPSRDAIASHKPYQLTVAQQIGLEIPPTLITNDPGAAREFWRAHPGEVIHKQLIALPESWRETRRLRDVDEEFIGSVAYAPVLFQRNIPAIADLRVTAIGRQLFAAATDVSGSEYPQDVRMNLNAHYTPHALPDWVADKVHTLMDRLGLVYGALDFRLTPDGRYIFLEINPAGQFLSIENDTGYPIAATLARQLTGTAD